MEFKLGMIFALDLTGLDSNWDFKFERSWTDWIEICKDWIWLNRIGICSLKIGLNWISKSRIELDCHLKFQDRIGWIGICHLPFKLRIGFELDFRIGLNRTVSDWIQLGLSWMDELDRIALNWTGSELVNVMDLIGSSWVRFEWFDWNELKRIGIRDFGINLRTILGRTLLCFTEFLLLGQPPAVG